LYSITLKQEQTESGIKKRKMLKEIFTYVKLYTDKTMTGVVASQAYTQLGLHKKGGVTMTAYEIISVIIGILTLLFTFGSLIVAILTFLSRDKKRKK
jgi:hypothetical protein